MYCKRKCCLVLATSFLMTTGFFKITIRHDIKSKKCSTGTEPIRFPLINPITNFQYRVSCLISKDKTKNGKGTYQKSYCGMFSRDLIGKAHKTSRFTTSTLQMVIKNHGWPTKYLLNLYQIKRFFSGPLFFEKKRLEFVRVITQSQLHQK